MRVAVPLAMLLLGGNLLDGEPNGTGPQQVARDSIDCGPQSLYLLLRLEGRPTELNKIVALLPPGERRGTSLLKLREAARALGLTLTGVKLGPTELNLDRPALVYLNRSPHDHFVVVREIGHTGKLIQVLDPNRPPEVWDKARLLASSEWSGFALIPSRPNIRLATVLACLFVVLAVCIGRMARKRSRAMHFLASGTEGIPDPDRGRGEVEDGSTTTRARKRIAPHSALGDTVGLNRPPPD